MKPYDPKWIQGLVQKSLHPHMNSLPHPEEILAEVQRFLDETCEILTTITENYNELIGEKAPQQKSKIFKLSPPKNGLILIKSKDKLVVYSSATAIHAKILHLQTYQEKILQTFTFEVQVSNEGGLAWTCLEDYNRVNPSLVARDYLSGFLIKGAKNYQ